ncbi:SDR family oxidoreductase [Prochlorococcus sp. MIT 1341]|uniref:SDR family oxidoreductase n=1 Tax=Prochlorococcus sp. MIT 1341 TaxID=3096221 RepID=UPI002A763B54|nr:SDR family oxidoreductase [Prochlorococcus sp. MIT 1341]
MPTALITGASRGIGKEAAKLFSASGWDLLLVSRDELALRALSEELTNSGNKVFYQAIDFSKPDEIYSGMDLLLQQGLCPSVLINNAGVAWTGDLLKMSLESWQWLFQMNLTSVFQVCAVVIPYMRERGGLVINVSSHASRNAFPQWGAYCTSKAALDSFTRCLAVEESQNSIRACTLTLGAVNTTLWDTDTVQSDFDRNAMLPVEKAAEALYYLAQQPSSQIVEDITLMPSTGAF